MFKAALFIRCNILNSHAVDQNQLIREQYSHAVDQNQLIREQDSHVVDQNQLIGEQ